jgi:hypothetical protein
MSDKIKIVSIDEVDRLQQRPAAEAIAELRECLTELYPCMESFGKAYPGVIAVAAIAGGEAHGIVAIAPSIKGSYCSVGAKRAVRELALIAANLTDNLRPIFEAELAKEQARRLKTTTGRSSTP